MGSPDARAYSRNKRGIAGSLIWINFDRHALLNLVQQCAGMFVADVDEIRPMYSNVTQGGAVFQSSVVRGAGFPVSASATINAIDQTTLTAAGQQSQLATPWYSDQVLPFDVTLSGANEYGAACAAKIFGVEILNEGMGISIDEAVTEMQATFVARVVEPMSAVGSPFTLHTRSCRPAGLKNPSRVRQAKAPFMIRLSAVSPAGSPAPGLRCAPSKHGKLDQPDKLSVLHHTHTPHVGEPEPVFCLQARRFMACLDC